jgi:hypothetical protein
MFCLDSHFNLNLKNGADAPFFKWVQGTYYRGYERQREGTRKKSQRAKNIVVNRKDLCYTHIQKAGG